MSYAPVLVKRTIRNFTTRASDFLRASEDTGDSRLNQLMHMVETDPIISAIVGPLLELPLDIDAIEEDMNNGWFVLRLPVEPEKSLAYTFQLLFRAYQGQLNLDSYGYRLFQEGDAARAWSQLQREVFAPAVRDLTSQLEDLIEDEVEGAAEVQIQVLQIFGNITAAPGSQVAIGAHIIQETVSPQLIDELVARARSEGAITAEQVTQLQTVLSGLGDELRKKEPASGVLQKCLSALWDLGEKSVIAFALEVIKHQGFIDAAVRFLLGKRA